MKGRAMSRLSILVDFWKYFKARRRWWLLPLVLFLFLMGLLIVLTQGSALAPFIYTIF